MYIQSKIMESEYNLICPHQKYTQREIPKPLWTVLSTPRDRGKAKGMKKIGGCRFE